MRDGNLGHFLVQKQDGEGKGVKGVKKLSPNIWDCLKKNIKFVPCYLQRTGCHMELCMQNDTLYS